ncbi:MAG: hypothetical protein VX641_02855 [Planctomycetota bacterium]|nr:hypothetical protein [Planctomycetota bacterium]
MTFIKRLCLTSVAAAMCISAAQAQQECVDSFSVTGSDGAANCYTDGSGYFVISWTGGCLATNLNYSGGDIDITANGFTGDPAIVFFGFEPGACETISITFEDGSVATAGEVCNDCIAAVCGNGICEAGEDATTCPDDCTAGECPAGQVADCDGSGECWTEAWIGDTYCDGTDQLYGADLCCYEGSVPGSFDGGDCTEAECAPPVGACCAGDGGCSNQLEADCVAAGGTWSLGSCEADFPCGFTEGCADDDDEPCDTAQSTGGCAEGLCCSTVCLIDSICCEDVWDSFCVDLASTACGAGGCPVGEVADCDGSGECWTEAWIGDSFCDGTAQQYGADLCCYDGGTAGLFDGGDCTEAECEVQVCGDGVCGPGENPTTCPDDCSADDCVTSYLVEGSTDLDGDGAVDPCYTDGTGYFNISWTGGCLATNLNYNGGADDIDITANNFTAGFVFFGFAPGECQNIILTFEDGSVAEYGEVCNDCGAGTECGNGVCEPGESFQTCPEDCEQVPCDPDTEIEDCDGSGECHPATWVADGFCDGTDQQYGADLCCYDGGTAGLFDGGDCTEAECSGGGGPVCGDGVCDAGEDATTCPEDCAVECPEDLNGDGSIGGPDLTILLAAWNNTGDDPSDLNGDGTVGGPDLTILLAAWGGSCE